MAAAIIDPSDAGHIWEYRICLPMTVEEYHIGQLWSVAEASKNETGGGEGLEVLINEPFNAQTHPPVTPLRAGGQVYMQGQYTKKIYHLKSKVPSFIRMLVPKGASEIHEDSWNAFPYCRTVVTNPDYMKEGFFIIIESFHAPDRGGTPNIHQLSETELAKREVHHIDITQKYDETRQDYNRDFDPTLVRSVKTKRGPLTRSPDTKGEQGTWAKSHTPIMCCYKLVRACFKYFMIQNRVEKLIMKQEKRLFSNFHRMVYCWMDRWYGLTIQDIRGIENATKRELDEKRSQGEVQGTSVSEV